MDLFVRDRAVLRVVMEASRAEGLAKVESVDLTPYSHAGGLECS